MRYPIIVYLLLTSFLQAQEYKFPAGVYPGQQDIYPTKETPEPPKPQNFRETVPAEATPTPYREIARVLDILPKPEVGFVDFGCGADARWCIAAAYKWKCKCLGMEIDPARARMARDRVKEEGLQDLITIYQGDASKYSYDNNADVGVAYLYPETLEKLKPEIEKLKAFASYIHKPPVDTGYVYLDRDTWIYTKPKQATQHLAVWNGVSYSGPVCTNPNCGMCASIRSQLAATQSQTVPKSPTGGHYVTQKVKICNGRSCWFEDRQVWVPD